MATLDTGIGSKWALALDGRGYLLSTLDEQSPFEFRAYTIEPIPLRVPRIDLSSEPGEQSLGSLWPRAQHSWHEGAGQEIFDSEFSSRFKYLSGGGIDTLKEKGALYIAPYLVKEDTAYFHSMQVVGGNLIVLDSLRTAYKFTAPDTLQGNSAAQASIFVEAHQWTSDGKKVYSCDASTGIYSLDTAVDFSTSPSWVKINNLFNLETMNFVKGRLMVGKGPSLHEITDLTTATDGATAIWTHLFTSWVFTVFEETGPGIFAGGFAGDISELLFISLDSSDLSSGVTLGVPTVAWRAPLGEIIHSLSAYSGAAMLMGTSRGLRNVIVGTDGDVQVSPLIAETPWPCTKVIAGAKFGYFLYGLHPPHVTGGAFIGKVDLSTLAWCLYTRTATGVSPSKDVVIWDDVPVHITNGRDIAFEDSDASILNGAWLETGETRFGTSEEKLLRKMDMSFSQENSGLNIIGDLSVPTDPLLSTLALPVVSHEDGSNEYRVVEVKMKIGNPTVLARCDLVTHGEPYGDLDANDQVKDTYWRFALDDLGSIRGPTFSINHLGTYAEYKASVSLSSTAIVAGDIVWFKVIFNSVTNILTFWYYIGDTDEPGSYVQLGTNVSVSVPITELSPRVSLPFYLGGGNSTASTNVGDTIYKARVWEGLGGDAQVLDWDSANPYIDKDGNEYSVVPRIYNATDDSVESYTPDPTDSVYDPPSRTRITKGVYAEVFIDVDDGGWESIGIFAGKLSKDLGVSFSGRRFKLKMEFTSLVKAPGKALQEWRLRAEPIPKPRYLRHYVPVMLYDRMTTVDGHHIHRDGFAQEELAILKGLYREGALLEFQPPDFSDAVKVRIDELHFKEFAPPKGASGFGGIALLVLREQE